MEFITIELSPKKLIGKSLDMSFMQDKTGDLWRSFLPIMNQVNNRVGNERLSLQFYSDDFMKNPSLSFTKWAVVEVLDFASVTEDMQTLEISGGQYAVFQYKGDIFGAPDFFRKIFSEIIPNSEYELDNLRPHFEILPEKYNPMDANSEEEVYIPIKLKE